MFVPGSTIRKGAAEVVPVEVIEVNPDVHLLIDCSNYVHQSNTLIWRLLFIKETVLYNFVTKMDFVIQYMYALYL